MEESRAHGSRQSLPIGQGDAPPSPINKKKGIRLRKLYSLGEDVINGMGGGVVPVQDACASLLQGRREAGGELAVADA